MPEEKDIHRELVSKGINISYPTVCRYIREKKELKSSRRKEVYLRIRHEPGEECQFDWGEVKLFIDGKQEALMMAVFAFPFSKGRFAYLFHRQDSLAFMESHRNFFKEVNGVPRVMVYDNMRVAVVFDNREKRPTEALTRLSTFIVSISGTATPGPVGKRGMLNVAWITSGAGPLPLAWILIAWRRPSNG